MQTGKYLIKTYGCQMNVHESEKLAGMLLSLGYTQTNNEAEADIIVFNTCCIRDGAEQKVFGNVGAIKKYKKKNPNLIVAICGCLTQAEGRAEIFKQKYPFVNIVFGTHNLHEFKNYVLNYKNTHKNIYSVWETEKPIDENVEMYRTSNLNAWVNIMYGCNNFCTYCIVPYVRGRERSRKMEDIVEEVKSLIASGYKVITLLGQNVNSYGNDLNNENVNFAILLKTLANLEGDFRIKFMTSHPKDLTDDVINVIAENKKLSKCIHLPVQSGSNRILKIMNRVYTKEHYLEVVNKIKNKVPNCFLSTDIIVGFPTETEEDFLETYHLIKEVEFGGVFAFMYSKRSGTVAEKMEGQIPDDVKHVRVNKILELSKSIIKKQNKLLIGSVQEILIEKKIKTEAGFEYSAICDNGKNVMINTTKNYETATYHEAKILDLVKNKLIAEILN